MSATQMTDKRKLQLSNATSLFDIHDRAMVRMQEWGKTSRYKTGWHKFDQYLYGGFGLKSDGELVVVAGDTKIGKSTFVANIAVRIAQNGAKVDYITLENSLEQTYGMLCKAAGVNSLEDYQDLIYTPDEDLIFGDEAWNAEDLILHMEHMVESRGINVFILDHLNFMFENEEHLANEIQRVRVVMRKLSRFCVKHKATVIAISHMNKGSGMAKLERPTIDRIYGSHAIAGAATKILLLNKQDPVILGGGLEQRRVEVHFVRSRHTPDQNESFMFDASQTQWMEIGVNQI